MITGLQQIKPIQQLIAKPMTAITDLQRVVPSGISSSGIATAAPDVDAGSGIDKTKVIVGAGIAVAIVGVLALVYSSKSSAIPNKGRSSYKKREYMKGYRAGRKFCGA